MRFALDIETACNVSDCANPKSCGHALDPYRNRITIIGLVWREESGALQHFTVRDVNQLKDVFADSYDYSLTGANLKWDLHTLAVHGFEIPLDKWADDISLMSTAYTIKVSEGYLESYAAKRKELNALLPKGTKHRNAKGNSLKVLAPFFLSIPAFWEDPTNHDSEEYVLKDCEYTYLLTEYFEDKLKGEGSYEFYQMKLMPWTKLLYKMERRGIQIDLKLLEQADVEAKNKAEEVKLLLDKEWEPAYNVYRDLEIKELRAQLDNTVEKAKQKAFQAWESRRAKAKTDRAHQSAKILYDDRITKIDHTYAERYAEQVDKIPRQMNLNSPVQLKWLFKDHLNLDIVDFNDEESTGKAVLQRLAGTGRKDMELFLEYRKQTKLTKAFFPTYRDLNVNGIIRASFNPSVARTGRLSSSDPNLQQVPGHLHRLFIARPGYKLITKDESAIEPRLLAYASSDLTLFDILKSGVDFHGHNTKIFFDLTCNVDQVKKQFSKEREVSKEVGLALMYGAGRFRLQESAQKRGFVWSSKECQRKLDRFKEAYEGVYAYREVINACLLDGPIKNVAGRLFGIADPQDVFMKGLNTYIQGGASDLVWNSAFRAQAAFEERGLDAHVLLLVHDEIVVEAGDKDVVEANHILERCMTDYNLTNELGRIDLKVEGKISDRWEK